MNTISIKHRVILIGLTVFTTISPPAHAEFKCDGRPLFGVDAKGCAAAAKGPDSLRRFVTRTQAIYGVQMKDYARFVDDEPSGKVALTTTKESVAKALPSAN